MAKRSMTARAPNSGAHVAQIAPRLAGARDATSVSGMFGREATTRSPGPTPRRSRAGPRAAGPGRGAPRAAPRRRRLPAEAANRQLDGVGGLGAAEHGDRLQVV